MSALIEYRWPEGSEISKGRRRHSAASLPPGPWTTEPDKAQWIDDATGLDCLIVRGPSGALCGYVGVPSEHPWHGLDYYEHAGDELCDPDFSLCSHSPEARVKVHGGLTYSDRCAESADASVGICHVPQPGRPADVWWFGFDCAHAFDLCPGTAGDGWSIGDETYRSFAYVQAEVASLAAQLAEAAR